MKNKINLKFFESVFWSLAALGLYNAVLQFAVYPAFSLSLGAEGFGSALTLMSVVAVVSASAGVGANYARMANAEKPHANGDYNRFLLVCAVICAVVSAASLFFVKSAGVWQLLLFPVCAVVVMLRYYSDVEFRLKLNYRRLFIFYAILSAGNLAGILLFRLTGQWETAILAGEIPAVAYVIFTGSIFRGRIFGRTENRRAVFGSCASLAAAQLFSTFILNADRLLINAVAGGAAVTVFYTASLLGKTTALLTGPFNGVVIGYLARYEKPVTKKFFALCVAGSAAAGGLLAIVMALASPVVIGLLYPGALTDAKPYFWLANSGQVLYFISNLLLVIALRFMRERIQLYINAGYAALYFALCVPALALGDMGMFVAAVFAANAARFAAVVIIGIKNAKGGSA